jgi:hypothetical protein
MMTAMMMMTTMMNENECLIGYMVGLLPTRVVSININVDDDTIRVE